MSQTTTQLTASQQAVISASGMVCAIAGPGAGKTRVIVEKVCHWIQQGGVDPTLVCVITFSGRAKSELRGRLGNRLGSQVANRVFVGTLHAMCKRMITTFRSELGFDPDRRVGVLGEADALALRTHVIGLAKGGFADPDEAVIAGHLDEEGLGAEISALKHAGLAPDQMQPGSARERVIQVLYKAYAAALKSRNVVDFDDMELLAHQLLTTNDDARKYFQATWSHICVDEGQDLSDLEFRIVQAMYGPQSEALVVGDQNQSIYAFRNALGGRVFDAFAACGAKIMSLPENHRNGANILAAAEAFLAGSSPRQVALRKGGALCVVGAGSGHDEARWLLGEIRALLEAGAKASEIAVLCRTREILSGIERTLVTGRLACKVAGSGAFFKQDEVQTVLAYMRMALDPESDPLALRRMVRAKDRAIAPDVIKRLRGDDPELLFEHLYGERAFSLLTETEQGVLSALYSEFDALCSIKSLAPSAAITFVMKSLGLKAFLARESTGEAAIERVRVLERLAREHQTIEAFLDECDMMSGEDPVYGAGEEAIQLATFHAAKGLEFPYVFIAGVEEGVIPSATSAGNRAERSEELRLLYVAVTRAIKSVVISFARLRERVDGFGTQNGPSSFLRSLSVLPRGDILKVAPVWRDLIGTTP